MASRGVYICKMFSTIVDNYDFLNALLSFGRDKYWRKFAVSKIEFRPGGKTLDVATGTGDLALELANRVGEGGKVIGIDFCIEMLGKARDKLAKTRRYNLEFICARAEVLPFPNSTFDCVSIAFGLRNVADIGQALQEITRVLKIGGKLLCLEFSQPKDKIFRQIYYFYIFHILPFLGRIISKNGEAYAYLPQSIAKFPSSSELIHIMQKVGLENVVVYPLTLGAVTIHIATKKAASMADDY